MEKISTTGWDAMRKIEKIGDFQPAPKESQVAMHCDKCGYITREYPQRLFLFIIYLHCKATFGRNPMAQMAIK